MEAQMFLNNEIKVTDARTGAFFGLTGFVNGIMADGRTLDVTLETGQAVFLDTSLVSEIREQTVFAKTPQSLGPIANSVVSATL